MGLFLIFKGISGMNSGKQFSKSNDTQSAIFTGLFHLQILLGFIMYFFTSNLTGAALANFGDAMKNSELRFWAVEHVFVMVIAAVIAQIGRIKIKKGLTDKAKFKRMAIYFGITLLLAASRIPWGQADRLFRS